jgi:serine/threonine protein kinase
MTVIHERMVLGTEIRALLEHASIEVGLDGPVSADTWILTDLEDKMPPLATMIPNDIQVISSSTAEVTPREVPATRLLGSQIYDAAARYCVLMEYELLPVMVGSGGQGTVYKACDTDGRYHAIKIGKFGIPTRKEAYLCSTLLGQGLLTRKVGERQMQGLRGASARFPEVYHCRVIEITSRHLVTPVIDMEFLPGKSLDSILISEGKNAFSPKDTARIGKEIVEGLLYLEDFSQEKRPTTTGSSQTDIKPANIVLVPGKGAYLVDLTPRRKKGISPYTLPFAAPELALQRFDNSPHTSLSGQTETFGVSATLYNLLAGEPPFGTYRSISLRDRRNCVYEHLLKVTRGAPKLLAHLVPKRLRTVLHAGLDPFQRNRPTLLEMHTDLQEMEISIYK